MLITRFRFSILAVGLLGLLTAAQDRSASTPPLPRRLSLRLNGAAVAADTVESRIEASPGAGKVLTLSILRRDSPDEPGLTILVDEFKPVPGVYRFKEILSAHVREASYRVGNVTAESKACAVNEGEVRITAVDAKQQVLTGSFRVVLCSTSAPRKAPKMVFEGRFRYPYEVR